MRPHSRRQVQDARAGGHARTLDDLALAASLNFRGHTPAGERSRKQGNTRPEGGTYRNGKRDCALPFWGSCSAECGLRETGRGAVAAAGFGSGAGWLASWSWLWVWLWVWLWCWNWSCPFSSRAQLLLAVSFLLFSATSPGSFLFSTSSAG